MAFPYLDELKLTTMVLFLATVGEGCNIREEGEEWSE